MNDINYNLTNIEFWEKRQINSNSNNKNITFSNLFKKYLKINNNYKCIEIGCAPGRFLAYFNKNFRYQIYGIDFVDKNITNKYLEASGVNEFTIYQENFENFTTTMSFDVVCSFGFIEHFNNYKSIFERHVDLLQNDGILIVEIPNFKYFQYVLRKYFDKEILIKHNLDIMEIKVLKQLADNAGLKILHLNYYHTMGFWIDNPSKNIFKKYFGYGICILFKLINFFVKIPNKYLSPYIVLVAQKQ